MKNFTLITIFFLLIQNICFSQIPPLKWAKQFGGNQSCMGYSVTVDKHGNVYTTGYFRGTIDFDPGTAVYDLTSTYVNGYALFITKLDSAGNFLWAKKIDAVIGNQAGLGIATDTLGNVYTTGYFYATVDFDPGPGIYNLTSPSGNGPFILKLDASGDFIWAKAFEDFNISISTALTVEPAGNVYVTGFFMGQADFDPGPAVYDLAGKVGGTDAFICKLDSAGNFVWAKQLGNNNTDYAYAICLDTAGHFYVTGMFNGSSAAYDPNFSALNESPYDFNDSVFVAKYDTSGNAGWIKYFRCDSSAEVKDIGVDASGNVYTAGRFVGTMDFDPGPAVQNITAAGREDLFVTKLDADGNLVWVKRLASANTFDWSSSEGLVLDKAGNIYVSGFFVADMDFDPGPGTNTLTSAGSTDAFIYKLDPSGNFDGACSFGAGFGERGNDLASDDENNIYAIGMFGQTVDFDPGNAAYNITSPVTGGWSTFLLKLGDTLSSVPIGLSGFGAMLVDSNVICRWKTYQQENTGHFIIERSIDATIYEAIGNVEAANHSLDPGYSYTDLTPYTTGKEYLYYRLKTIDKDGHFTYSNTVKIKLRYGAVLNIFPNPVNDHLLIGFNSPVTENGIVFITDHTGKKIFEQQLSIKQGNNSFPVNTSKLAAGIYILSVNGSNHYSNRFIKN